MECNESELNSETKASKLPKCAFCGDIAYYDGMTRMGLVAYMCMSHFAQYGIGLGHDKGQWFVELKTKCKIARKNENIFILAGRIAAILQKSGKTENTREFCDRLLKCKCYDDALALIHEYAKVY